MFERYETDKLYVATVRNLYLQMKHNNKNKRDSYYKTKRKGIIYDDGNHLVDITRPNEDITEMTFQHQVHLSDMEPLYPKGVHKVVSKRQAYKQYVSKKKKKTI